MEKIALQRRAGKIHPAILVTKEDGSKYAAPMCGCPGTFNGKIQLRTCRVLPREAANCRRASEMKS